MSHIGQRVVRPLLYLGLYLAEEKLDKLSNTIILLKHVLERLCVPKVHEAIRIPKSENNIGAPSAPQKEGCMLYSPFQASSSFRRLSPTSLYEALTLTERLLRLLQGNVRIALKSYKTTAFCILVITN